MESVTNDRVAEKAVIAGIWFLRGKIRTRYFYKRISLDTLDIGNPLTCLLGQLFGDCNDGYRALGITVCDGVKYGFARHTGGSNAFSVLNELWKRELRILQSGGWRAFELKARN